MFNIFKRKDETPVEDISPTSVDSGVVTAESLKTEDGGYLGPGNRENDIQLNRRNNYQSTADTEAPIPQSYPRRASTLNASNDPRTGSKGWDDNASVSTVQSNVKKERCCNPDYKICGGCCYPYACFGFSGDQKLVMLSVGIFAILVGLIVGIILLFTTVVMTPKLCMTPECVVAAGEIISGLDQKIDPCDSFVDFTCGGWKRMHPVPNGAVDVDAFAITNDKMFYKIKQLLEAPPKAEDPRAVNLTKTFYRACANDSAWSEAGVFPLLNEVARIGGFPMVNATWTNTTYDWLKSIITMRRLYAADYLIGLSVSFDSKNSSKFALHIGEGFLPTPRQMVISNDTFTRKREMERIVTVAQVLGAALAKQNFKNTSKYKTMPMGKIDEILQLNTKKKNTTKTKPQKGRMDERMDLPTSSKNDNDTLLELLIGQNNHKKKMQMRRSESVIILDGIAPGLDKIDPTVKLQRQSEAPTNETGGGGGEESTDNQAIADVYNLWSFIYNLSNISMSSEEAQDQYAQYNPMTIQELQESTDKLGDEAAKINWLDYINAVFADSNIKLESNTRIIVSQPKYLKNILKLIKTTPKRVIANYLSYMLSLNMGEEVSSPGFAGLNEEKKRAKNIGRSQIRPWFDCSTKANLVMSNAVSYLYVRDAFKKDSIKTASEMVSDVHTAFRDILVGTTWMDDNTTVSGQEKLTSMLQLVGYGENTTNAKILDENYEQVPEMLPYDHFGNIMKLARYLSNKSLSVLNDTPERSRFTMPPVTINAAYSFSQNAMIIPAGILQSPFFRRNTLPALNYGALGVIIGHEISHGFDDAGREVDSNGNLRQWWTNASKETYNERAKCFKTQYSRFPLPEDFESPEQAIDLENYKVNGGVTMGENIADNGGLRAAWGAFQSRLKNTGYEHPRLPGLEHYSPEQLFFISFAQLWCTNYTPMGLKASLLVGAHAPGPFRVKGCFENNKAMRETFQCDRKVSDDFEKVCKLW